MDFAILPPEVNSGRIYTGPGSAPLVVAAAAWDGLAEDLYTSASAHHAIVSELTDQDWSGSAATAMATAAAQFVDWTVTTAMQAQQAASQARAAVAAFETAFAMTVPPPVIAANRSQLHALIATNVVGQNFPAIAATEADYAEMWAQDAAAMYSYAAASAAASALAPFTAPQPVSNPGGMALQAAAVTQDAGNASTQSTVSAISRLLSEVPSALQQLSQGAAPGALTDVGPLSSLLSSSPLEYLSLLTPYTASVATARLGIQAAAFTKGNAVTTPAVVPTTGTGCAATQSLVSNLSSHSAAEPVAAHLGRAELAGGLSVPHSWATSVPAARGQVVPRAAAPTSAVGPLGAAPGPTGVISDMSMTPVLGRPSAGSNSSARRGRGHTTVMVCYPSAG